MSDKLKPCPFCGCKNIDKETSEGEAFCSDCGVMVTIEEWNTRTESEEIDFLKGEVARLFKDNIDTITKKNQEIERLKCCDNCKHNVIIDNRITCGKRLNADYTCVNNNNWEQKP